MKDRGRVELKADIAYPPVIYQATFHLFSREIRPGVVASSADHQPETGLRAEDDSETGTKEYEGGGNGGRKATQSAAERGAAAWGNRFFHQ